MALVCDGMPCALCGRPIDDPMRDTFATTMWGMDDPRFAILDDAACHQSCLDHWELRDEFVSYYNRNCNDELHVDRNGHVAYRFDYSNWLLNAIIVAFGLALCLPSLVLLEWNWKHRSTRVIVGLLPYALLGLLIALMTIQGSFYLAWRCALLAWLVATAVSYLIAFVIPSSRDRQRLRDLGL